MMYAVICRNGGLPLLVLSCWLAFLLPSVQAQTIRVQLREPGANGYLVETPPAHRAGAGPEWIMARPERGGTNLVGFSSRVFLRLNPGTTLAEVLTGSSLKADREVAPNTYIVQAPDAWVALQEAERLGKRLDVESSSPIAARPRSLHGLYAARPSDTYFGNQYHLENRSSVGIRLGADINVRSAWPYTKGEGVVLALADDGVEMNHPDLASRATGPSLNFGSLTANGNHPVTGLMHGTAVSGLMAGAGNNGLGVSGVAPGATFASWVVFTNTTANGFVSEERFMDMYMYQSNVVWVQNHSWGNDGTNQIAITGPEEIGIGLAITNGRFGRGVVMVRSAGNDRNINANSNDDGFTADPRVIAVGAVRIDGRVGSYSEPGANLLVAAPGGDFSPFTGLFTTDRQGTLGFDFLTYPTAPDRNNYISQFIGTSGAAPIISGIAALILSVNTNLTYRDVQQILLNAGVQFDLADPDLTTNGAGYVVGHNTGFGVPDAGWAVQLAKAWSNRPARLSVCFTNNAVVAIPDDGLRVVVSGSGLAISLTNIPARPTDGLHPDKATAWMPLVNVGQGTSPLTTNLTGKAALMQRGGAFATKVQNAYNAGAAFVVIYNNASALPYIMDGDFLPLPMVMIPQTEGEALAAHMATHDVTARLRLDSALRSLAVTNTLVCEHVQVRLKTDHSVRGDLRVTLTSPAGTVSVLQFINSDTNNPLTDWTYLSTHHFYEGTAGTWTVAVTDEFGSDTGNVQEVVLTLHGVPIVDVDADGLDDAWETAHFGSLASGPKDDPDADGSVNAREQVMGTDPLAKDVPFKLEPVKWSDDVVRLTWPGAAGSTYQVFAGTNVSALTLLTNIAGKFPETEFLTTRTNLQHQFFRVGETISAP